MIRDEPDIMEEIPPPHNQLTEAQVTLLCLDYLRDLRRSYASPQAMSEINLNSNFISLAIFALAQAFQHPSNLEEENDPTKPQHEVGYYSQIYSEVIFAEKLTKLPSIKKIESTFITESNEYHYVDGHPSNQERFYHLNGLASGSPHPGANAGGPISLIDIAGAGLSNMGARSRGDAEEEMVEGPLFEQFLGAVREKGFFKDSNGNSMRPSSETYGDRYRKVVSKFRSKLADKAEKALAESYLPTQPQSSNPQSNLLSPPNVINVSSDLSWSLSNQQQKIQTHNSLVKNPSKMDNHLQRNKSTLHTNEIDIREAEQLKNKGNQQMQAKNYRMAVESYTAALKILPSGPTSHVYFSNRAAALLSLKQYHDAIDDSERSLALKPHYGKAYARLGLAYFLVENYELSVQAYNNALKYEPESKSTKSYLEKAKKKLKETQLRKTENPKQEKIITLDSFEDDERQQQIIAQKEADAFKIEGNNFMSKKMYQEAVECYSTAINLCPRGFSSHVYYSNRAAALCYLERYEEAEHDSEFSIELKPDYGKAYARLGLSRFFLEDYEGAVDAYTTALELDPDNTACMSYLEKARKKLNGRDIDIDPYDGK